MQLFREVDSRNKTARGLRVQKQADRQAFLERRARRETNQLAFMECRARREAKQNARDAKEQAEWEVKQ